MITKKEAMVEMRKIMEPALKEINVIAKKIDQEFDNFAADTGFNGARNGLSEALWLIDYQLKHAKSEG